MEIRDKIFSEVNMYKRLKKAAKAEELTNFEKAIDYAKTMHNGMKRKSNRYRKGTEVPYIAHPLMMACHAHALGIKDDTVLSVIMLHDVCEECDITPEQLPFPKEITEEVKRLTKKEGQDTAEYYRIIGESSTASIVKALDRVNNVSTMASSFPKYKELEYIEETEKYVYPLLDKIKIEYTDYSDAVFVIKYHLRALLETSKCLIIGENIN